MKKLLLLTSLLLLGMQSYSQFQLRVGDPRNSWYTDRGTIEEAAISVKPQGIYTEYNLFLSFSSRGTQWTSVEDSLEITLNFELPENSIVHDSWLWIEGVPERGKILDKWTASSIYESIVQRRKDPSILYKTYNNRYELRIFPMAGNETRKVKLTFLLPVEWGQNTVSSSIPTTMIFPNSRFKPSPFDLYVWTDGDWKNPRILAQEDLVFREHSNPDFEGYKKMEMPIQLLEGNWDRNPLNIVYDNPMKDGMFLSKYQSGSEGYYQLAVFPSSIITTIPPKKVAVLVDYDVSNTNMSRGNLLSLVKQAMLNHLCERDSFNLMLSGITVNKYSENWMSSTESNIEDAFKDGEEILTSYSNLASLIGSGIEFIKEKGSEGKIILISNSDQYDNYEMANTLIHDINEMTGQQIPIHISDYQSMNYYYYYVKGRTYTGNEYLYYNLSKLNSGTYQGVRNNMTASEVIGKSFKHITGTINSFDLYTSMAEGFCHGRYLIGGNYNYAYLSDPILQVGQFKGTFPFQVEISGEQENQILGERFILGSEDIFDSDSINKVIWTGHYIHELEAGEQNNDVINEIIHHSIEERVLSKYTAFICLEKDYEIDDDPEYDEDDQNMPIKRPDIKEVVDTVKVFPNPFQEHVKIEIISSTENELKDLAIYDISGKLIYKFDISDFEPGSSRIFEWNGKNSAGEAVRAGVYLLVCKTSKENRTVRLMKL